MEGANEVLGEAIQRQSISRQHSDDIYPRCRQTTTASQENRCKIHQSFDGITKCAKIPVVDVVSVEKPKTLHLWGVTERGKEQRGRRSSEGELIPVNSAWVRCFQVFANGA